MSKKINKKILIFTSNVLAIILVLVFALYFSFLNPPAHAQNANCIGPSLANYVADVFDDLGTTRELNNVRFLSPAFNMSHPEFESLVASFSAGLGDRTSRGFPHNYSFNSFYAVAGNAYNTPSGNIHGWINRARMTAIGNSRLVLTEIGFHPPSTHDVGSLPSSISDLQADGSIITGLLFNVFGNNQDPNFAGHIMSDEEINTVCGGHGNCGKIGANSARYYSSTVDSFYNRAQSHGMEYTIEIATNNIVGLTGESDSGILRAHERGITPILRLGVGSNSGGFDNPADLANFIRELDSATNEIVYIILGPNEPISECWATRECGCDPSSEGIGGITQFIITMEWPPDPATFYIAEKGNTDLIEAISNIVATTPGFRPPPGWQPSPIPVPPPSPGAVILDIDPLYQTDDRWADINLGISCNPIQNMPMRNYGCGPTSIAMIISYLYPERPITPGVIGENIDTSTGVVCGTGTAYMPIANWLINERGYNDLHSVSETFNVDAIADSISIGRPVVVYCRNWGTSVLNWNHISVIKGVDSGFIYFQDPIRGEVAYAENIVVNEFLCDSATSFWR